MSEIKLISPMLDNFCIGDPISDQNGVRSCPAMQENEEDRYIVKVVSIPASQTKLDALLLAGAYPDADTANLYFKELADDVVRELETLQRLSGQEGFLPVINWQIVPMEHGETGYDVYILTSYKRTLKRQFYKEPLTHLNAINLGLDICAALATCRQSGYLYVNLKPSNIFVTDDKKYKISDLGFVKLDALQFASLPSQYRSAYTAPEVTDAFSALSNTMDIYALGLVLYQAYNNGALPFDGDIAPGQVFPPPDYADYEMSEIILKACDPDPENRWQNPIELGQALINYMQRNGANDTPIVPPVPVFIPDTVIDSQLEAIISEVAADSVENSENTAEAATDKDIQQVDQSEDNAGAANDTVDAECTATEADDLIEDEEQATVEQPSYQEDELGNLSFLADNEDVPLEELGINDQSYDALSDDVSEILEQADILATHDVPDMDSVIEQTDIEDNSQETVLDENNAQQEHDDPDAADDHEDTPESDVSSHDATVIFGAAESAQSENDSSDTAADEPETDTEEISNDTDPAEDDPEAEIKPKKRRWVGILVTALILLALAAGCYFGYNYYYIKEVHVNEPVVELDTITVSVETNADPSLLTVYCISNGNRIPAELVNGKAYFSNLLPDQYYTIEVEISGFHGLKGTTTATCRTPSQIALEGLQVKVGETDGSAWITFTTKKPYNGQWNVSYSTEGEEPKSAVSDTEDITLNGLTVGKTYNITVTPVDDHSWVTNNTVSYTALPLILAQNSTVADYTDGNLTLTWQSPATAQVSSWTVHCYNDTDYNKTVTVSDCTAIFEGLDPMKSYTVEIYAEQQSKCQMLHIDDATLPIDNFAAEIVENNFIKLSWSCTKETPAEGWILRYTLNGVADSKTLTTADNTLLFKEVIPGATYVFTIEAGNGAPVIATEAQVTAPEAENYSSNYDDVPVTKDNITLKMCTPPDKDSWSYKSLYSSDYTTTLKSGEKAGFVTRMTKYYSPTNESEVLVLYVIRNEEGQIVMYSSEARIWADMWNYYYGALTIPELPTEAGKYSVDIYFNGGFVGSQNFEITE